MSKRTAIVIFLIALIVLAGAIFTYAYTFGFELSNNRTDWSGFGNYLGGLISPSFALLALGALLWSVHIQGKALEDTKREMSKQTDAANKQLRDMQEARLVEEAVAVLRAIDSRIESLLETSASPVHVENSVTLRQMVAESERLAGTNAVGAYLAFIETARDPGSVAEALTRDLEWHVARMRRFLESLSLSIRGQQSPSITFYADRVYRLVYLLEDIGRVPEDTRSFFATVSDSHG